MASRRRSSLRWSIRLDCMPAVQGAPGPGPPPPTEPLKPACRRLPRLCVPGRVRRRIPGPDPSRKGPESLQVSGSNTDSCPCGCAGSTPTAPRAHRHHRPMISNPPPPGPAGPVRAGSTVGTAWLSHVTRRRVVGPPAGSPGFPGCRRWRFFWQGSLARKLDDPPAQPHSRLRPAIAIAAGPPASGRSAGPGLPPAPPLLIPRPAAGPPPGAAGPPCPAPCRCCRLLLLVRRAASSAQRARGSPPASHRTAWSGPPARRAAGAAPVQSIRPTRGPAPRRGRTSQTVESRARACSAEPACACDGFASTRSEPGRMCCGAAAALDVTSRALPWSATKIARINGASCLAGGSPVGEWSVWYSSSQR